MFVLALAAVVLLPLGAVAQDVAPDDETKDVLQHLRPYDQRGLHIFENPKTPGVPYTGFEIYWGASFAQQMQSLSHSNAPDSSRSGRDSTWRRQTSTLVPSCPRGFASTSPRTFPAGTTPRPG